MVAQNIQESFGAPKHVFPAGMVILGYRDEDPELRPRLSLEAVIHRSKYHDPTDDEIRTWYRHRDDRWNTMNPDRRAEPEKCGIRSYAQTVMLGHYTTKFTKWESNGIVENLPRKAGTANCDASPPWGCAARNAMMSVTGGIGLRIYISADIEGITGIRSFEEATKGKLDNGWFRKQMTAEVAAACRGARTAGADTILVQDAHDGADNLLLDELPAGIGIIRGWSGHPLMMVQELDPSFDAVVMIGYHAGAGTGESPIEHSCSLRLVELRLNGAPVSEFAIHTYAAAVLGVPVVFVSGDEGLCREVKRFDSKIRTVATKRGTGAAVVSLHPQDVIEQIEQYVREAVEALTEFTPVALPNSFEVELRYRKHPDAATASFFPGAKRLDPFTVSFTSSAYEDILRFLLFVL